MDDLPDLEIRASGESPSAPAPTGPTVAGLGVVVIAIAVLAAVYFVFRSKPLPSPKPETHAAAVVPAEPAAPGSDTTIDLPPLDQSDALVRSLVRGLSNAPAIAAWLATDGLIRSFTVAVNNIAEGRAPRKGVTPLGPRSPFRIVERNGGLWVEPASYQRYDGVADAVDSIDAAGAARVYTTLKPRISEAYQELGPTDPSFDHELERAIAVLLATPIIDKPVALKMQGIGYAYVDDRLEDLTGAQKQLLRMGPRNVALVERQLRAVAAAIGIGLRRLPPP